MDPFSIAALAVIALGSLASTLVTNKQNRDLFHENQNWQESMVDKQNEYNSPVNQVERAKAAGINPVAAGMANGTTLSSSSASPSGVNTPTMLDPMTGMSSALFQLMSGYNQGAQGKTVNSLREYQIQLAKDQSAQYQANILKLGVDTKGQMIANDYAAALNEVALQQGKANIDLTYAQVAKCRQEVKNLAFELTDVLPQQVKESISREGLNVWEQNKVVAEIERTYAETENIIANTEFQQAQTDTEGLKQSNIVADTSRVMSETQSLDKQIQMYLDTYDDMVTKIANEAKITKKQARWFIINSILGNAQSAAVTGASTVGAAKMLSTMGRAATVAGF